MAVEIKNNNYRFLSVKDIMNICDCSKYIATKLRNDIAEEYNIKSYRVTFEHLSRYLKLA